MKALICRAFGPPRDLRVEDVPEPKPASRGVRIAVAAAGLNFPDVLMVQGLYQVKPPFPFSPGAEVSGTVIETGADVRTVRPGDRVAAFVSYGGFAQEVAAAEANVFKLPAGIDMTVAAGFGLTYGTAYHALHDRGHLAAGETLLVTGAGGGVGLAAVELGVAAGARVIAAASSREKLDAARAAGAHECIDYTEVPLRERVEALTDRRGPDVVFDPVGGDVFDACLRCVAWGGRLLIIGFASGRIPDIPANRLLLRGCDAVGVFWGSFATRDAARNQANFAELFAMYAAGTIRPTVHATFDLDDAVDAIEAMRERRLVGKAVITVAGN